MSGTNATCSAEDSVSSSSFLRAASNRGGSGIDQANLNIGCAQCAIYDHAALHFKKVLKRNGSDPGSGGRTLVLKEWIEWLVDRNSAVRQEFQQSHGGEGLRNACQVDAGGSSPGRRRGVEASSRVSSCSLSDQLTMMRHRISISWNVGQLGLEHAVPLGMRGTLLLPLLRRVLFFSSCAKIPAPRYSHRWESQVCVP